jgi:uncharacterized protein with von Willebrand factor type A (vWA) domain
MTDKHIVKHIVEVIATLRAAGFVVVPVEPTDAMIDAALSCHLDDFSRRGIVRAQYRAMVAAAAGNGVVDAE